MQGEMILTNTSKRLFGNKTLSCKGNRLIYILQNTKQKEKKMV